MEYNPIKSLARRRFYYGLESSSERMTDCYLLIPLLLDQKRGGCERYIEKYEKA